MFDRRRGWDVWRPFSPMRPVYVDIDRVLPAADPDPAVPRRVAEHGLRLSGRMPGLLRAWHRLSTGGWIASVEVPVRTGDHWVFLDFVTSADAVTPREDDIEFPQRPTNQWGRPLHD
ncbi:hypothetical protein ACWEKT_31930 [Nocardia takedensis]